MGARTGSPPWARRSVIAAALTLVAATAGEAHADDGAAAAALSAGSEADKTAGPKKATSGKLAAAAKAAPSPERAAVFLKLSAKGKAVGGAIERRLGMRPELRVQPLARLVSKGDERPKVKAAFADVDKGELQLANMEVEKGLKTITAAVKRLEDLFHVVGPDGAYHRKYARALTTLALAHFLAGNKSKTSEWLSRALVMDPKTDYDKKRFPPKMKEVFDAVHFLATELGKGKGKIDTSPAGALVSINGKPVGRAPSLVDGLVVGRNLVTVSALGYAPKTVPLNVVGGKDAAKVSVSLGTLPGDPLALLGGAVGQAAIGNSERPKKAAKRLGVELLILGQVKGQGDRFEASLYAYDSKASTFVGRSKGVVRVLEAEGDIGKLVDGLFASIRLTRSPPKPKPQGPGFFSRMTKSKWFWPVVGAVAGAAVIAGATVGIVAATSGDNRRRNAILLPAFSHR